MQSSQDGIQGRTRSLDFRGTAPWHLGLEPRSAEFWVRFIAVTLQKCTTFTCEKFQGLRVGSQPSDASFACTQGRTHSPHSRRARGLPFWMMSRSLPTPKSLCFSSQRQATHSFRIFSLLTWRFYTPQL